MPTEAVDPDTARLSPDEAFTVLGDTTRLSILQELGHAEGPLPFNELRERIGYDDSGNFQYHLNKLRGHFVRQTDEGYELRQPGVRVVGAILSGAVTERPHLDEEPVDWPCPYCGGQITISYGDDETGKHLLSIFCTECLALSPHADHFEPGQVGDIQLSPAGIKNRTPDEVIRAAITWDHFEMLGTYYGVCPHCQAVVEQSVNVCEDHDPNGTCASCERRYPVEIHYECTNCLFDLGPMAAASGVLKHFELLSFLIDHDINPFTDAWGPVAREATEEVLSTEPLRIRYTYTLDGDSLVLILDEDLSVLAVDRSDDPNPP